MRNFTHKITQTRLNRQTGLFDTASQFFRFSFASYGFCFIWRRCSTSHVQRLDITQRKMFRTIVGWATLDLEDWRATMRRMNDILNAAMPYTSIHPINRWSDEIFKKQFSCLFVVLPIWIDGLVPRVYLSWSPRTQISHQDSAETFVFAMAS